MAENAISFSFFKLNNNNINKIINYRISLITQIKKTKKLTESNIESPS